MTRPTRLRTRPSSPTLAAGVTVLAALLLVPLALAPRAEAYIYWTNKDAIGRANLDGTGVDQSFIAGMGGEVKGIADVAVDGAHVYWSYGSPGPFWQVGRANLDGTGVDPSFIDVISLRGCSTCAPPDLAVDAAHIYLTRISCFHGFDPCTAAIDRANLDGTGVEEGFIRPTSVSGVAVDANYIYWTLGYYSDVYPGGRIGRADLEGTAVDENFISAPLVDSTNGDLAVDPAHIYWSLNNYTPTGGTGAIARANLDGTGFDREFIPLGPNYNATDIAVDTSHVYWMANVCDPGGVCLSRIDRANLDGTRVDKGFIRTAGSADGVAVDGLTDTRLVGKASAARTQRQTGKKVVVKVRVKAKEPLTAKASGKIKVNPTYRLRPKKVKLDTGKNKTLKLKPKKAKAKKVAAALKRGGKANAKLKVTLTDPAGNSETERLRVRLKRP